MNKSDYKIYEDKMKKSIDSVTADFARQIGVDYYSDGPQDLVETLNKLSA